MSTQLNCLYDEAECIGAVAGYGIPGSLTVLPAAPLSTGGWTSLLADVQRHRLDALLAAAVAQTALPVDDRQAEDVRRLHATVTSTVLGVNAALAEVVDVLEQIDVETRVLDGTAVANLDYHHGSQLRTFSTLEVLVRREAFAQADPHLTAQGYRRAASSSPDAETARFTTPNGLRLLVHRGLGTSALGLRVDEDRVWKCSESFTVADRTVRALGRAERLLHACCRASAGDAQGDWGRRRDVAEAALHPDLDARHVLALASEWGAEHVLAEAITSTWLDLRLADVVALSSWAQAQQRVVSTGRAQVTRLPVGRARQPLLARLAGRVLPVRMTAGAPPGGG